MDDFDREALMQQEPGRMLDNGDGSLTMTAPPWQRRLEVYLGGPRCELCGRLNAFDYEGHRVCSHCALLACGKCWSARMVERRSWLRLGLMMRYQCPKCGAHGRWQS